MQYVTVRSIDTCNSDVTGSNFGHVIGYPNIFREFLQSTQVNAEIRHDRLPRNPYRLTSHNHQTV